MMICSSKHNFTGTNLSSILQLHLSSKTLTGGWVRQHTATGSSSWTNVNHNVELRAGLKYNMSTPPGRNPVCKLTESTINKLINRTVNKLHCQQIVVEQVTTPWWGLNAHHYWTSEQTDTE